MVRKRFEEAFRGRKDHTRTISKRTSRRVQRFTCGCTRYWVLHPRLQEAQRNISFLERAHRNLVQQVHSC